MRCRKRLGEAAPGKPAAAAQRTEVAPTPIVVDRAAALMFLQGAMGLVYATMYIVPVFKPILVVLIGLVSAALFASAWGFRAMRPWGRKVMIGWSLFGLLGIPIGTAIYGALLAYLFQAPVRLAFAGTSLSADEARQARQATELWKPFGVLLGVFNLLFTLVLLAGAVALLLPRFLS